MTSALRKVSNDAERNDATAITRRAEQGVMAMGNSREAAARRIPPQRTNIVRPNGNVLPREKFTTDDVAKAQGEVLKAVFGQAISTAGTTMRVASPAKEQARITGQSERACRNQQAGENCMSLAEFFNACQSIPELRAWGAMMMGLEQDHDPAFGERLEQGVREIVLRLDMGAPITNVRIPTKGE